MNTVIFDFDGTIADSFDFVLNFLIKQTGSQPLTDIVKRGNYRQLSMIAIARQLDISWWRLPLLLISGRREMAAHIPHVPPVKGMIPVIRELHKSGYQLLIVSTNSSRAIKKFLDHNDLSDCFSGVTGSVGVFGKAPALRRLIRSRRLSKNDCVYIGDEIRDIEASAFVGLDCIAVIWGFASQDFLKAANALEVVNSPAELLKAITTKYRS